MSHDSRSFRFGSAARPSVLSCGSCADRCRRLSTAARSQLPFRRAHSRYHRSTTPTEGSPCCTVAAATEIACVFRRAGADSDLQPTDFLPHRRGGVPRPSLRICVGKRAEDPRAAPRRWRRHAVRDAHNESLRCPACRTRATALAPAQMFKGQGWGRVYSGPLLISQFIRRGP